MLVSGSVPTASSPRSSLVVQDPLDPFSVDGCGTFGLLLSVLIMDSGPGVGGGHGGLCDPMAI